jgi:hypothetical protein
MAVVAGNSLGTSNCPDELQVTIGISVSVHTRRRSDLPR